MRSLIGRTLWQVALRIGLVVAIASVLAYWHVRESLKAQALQHLAAFVEERRARESAMFVLAADQLGTFAQSYRDAYRLSLDRLDEAAVEARFADLFQRREDGALRLSRAAFECCGLSGGIGGSVPVDIDLKRRLLVAFEHLARFGPAYRARFANTYVVTPERAVLMYWPEQPWALDAADWQLDGKLSLISPVRDGVVIVGETPATGEHELWSSLYFDYAVNDWLVSATEPVTLEGRHLLSAGHDILLHELLDRVLASPPDGCYNLLLDDDGRLIAHPRLMEAIQANGGALSIAATGDHHLARILERVRGRAPEQTIVENAQDREYLAATRLAGPGWTLVSVFPGAIIDQQAFVTARIILLLGAAALLIEVGVLYLVLKRQVALPLRRLVDASRRIAVGQRHVAIAVERDDELGDLARSFDAMAGEIEARAHALRERSQSLAELNQRLAGELEERQRMAAEMVRQREELHQSEKIKALGSLLASIAHELNNPLSVVVGRSVLLEEKLRDTPHQASVQKVRASAERCAHIVKTFLAMARQQAPSHEPVALDDVIASALDLTASRLRASAIETEVRLPPGLPAVRGDAGQLGQLFANLFVNAQQAMAEHPGERRLCIEASTAAGGRHVVIRVADSGPGIPAQIRHRIFEPFFTTKAAGVGTGMGLSICFRIVEVHGGTLRVESDGAAGAVFVITLPLAFAGDAGGTRREELDGHVQTGQEAADPPGPDRR